MQIYRVGNRMFMIIEADDAFSFEKKSEIDAKYPENEKWEEIDVEVSAGTALCETWRKMDVDEKGLSDRIKNKKTAKHGLAVFCLSVFLLKKPYLLPITFMIKKTVMELPSS